MVDVEMDDVEKLFDNWSNSGRAEDMEKGHKTTTLPFLNSLKLNNKFSFLEIGCGNGWIIRNIVKKDNCIRALGIDKSFGMIKRARSMSKDVKEQFIHTDFEKYMFNEQFDIIFSMEVLYYMKSIQSAINKIYTLTKSQGIAIFGTDFYLENKDTSHWGKEMNLKLHLFSIEQWNKLWTDVGFTTKITHVTDPTSNELWKRDIGTLFITSTKP